MEDDFFTIRVNILNTSYPINIKREEEEIYRKAAKQLNNKILDYQKKYSQSLKEIDFLIMTAFELSLDCVRLSEEKEREPFISKIQDIDKRLTGYLNKGNLSEKTDSTQ